MVTPVSMVPYICTTGPLPGSAGWLAQPTVTKTVNKTVIETVNKLTTRNVTINIFFMVEYPS